ncbi:HlyD family secretion protein [Patescibacteria group bacterium]|nr:HlyD family secretion protein [Patescibacteria group bacterium]
MFSFVRQHHVLTGGIVIAMLAGSYFVYERINRDPLEGLVTTTIERGTVEKLVSVSGITKARNTAELGFPSPGTVSKVYVREGDTVVGGTILATLGADELVAARASALADLAVAQADRAELVTGDTITERDITETKVAIAEAELKRIEETQAVLIANAKRALRSGTPIARSEDADESAPAPTISGTYRCEKEGSYILTVYRSGADSGYSMRITGLETGSASVSTDQPTPFGTCGLFALFTDGAQYSNSVWTVTIPNTTGESYTINKNALAAAENTARTSIAAAKQALTLAQQEQASINAAPRSEALARANARINKASATIAQIDAQIGDRAIIAPFSGTVTKVDIVAGETTGTLPLFTLLSTDDIELKARIPEIDITTITTGQSARIIFDAEPSTPLSGVVTYISPLPTEIDGVSYFEITIILNTRPDWLRSGLNADIDIITEFTENLLRIPKRYLVENSEGAFIRVLQDSQIATSSVLKEYEGNDGWVGITGVGVTEGMVIVNP